MLYCNLTIWNIWALLTFISLRIMDSPLCLRFLPHSTRQFLFFEGRNAIPFEGKCPFSHLMCSHDKIRVFLRIHSVLQVKSGSSVVEAFEKGRSYGLPSYVTYTVSLSDPRLASKGSSLSTALTVSSTATDQSITIPVTMIYVSDRTGSLRCKFYSHCGEHWKYFSRVYCGYNWLGIN